MRRIVLFLYRLWAGRCAGRFLRFIGLIINPLAPARTGVGADLQPCDLWFHAASAGELEILWPVIEGWARLNPKASCALTVFSRSGLQPLQKLKEVVQATGVRVTYSGVSPWEGFWGDWLEVLRPKLWVTAKYEAWPELWASLTLRGTPLLIVSAQSRSSLSVARLLCQALVGRLPRMVTSGVDGDTSASLRAEFAQARSEVTGDPRWDRVQARIQRGSERVAELISWAEVSGLMRPWWVFGSIWPADLDRLISVLDRLPGTQWWVPHVLSETEALASVARRKGLEVIQTSKRTDPVSQKTVVLVDEVGILAELYGAADAAFVGGGYGKGVHSTLEPASFGIPVACGPSRAERFPEIAQLMASGQLLVDPAPETWMNWALSIKTGQREGWKRQAEGRLGASRRVIDLVQRAQGSW